MKKLFLGITYLLMIVLSFVYNFIPFMLGPNNVSVGVWYATAGTGLPAIGVIFLIPSFIFTVISLVGSKNTKMTEFLKDVFVLFASAFIVISLIFSLVQGYAIYQFIAPIILGLSSGILLICGTIGVVTALRNEKLEKSENKENVKIIQ